MADRASGYRLSPKALSDLEEIWLYGATTWSPERADHSIDDLAHIFDMLVAMPEIVRERMGFTPPVRLHVHGRHLIVYMIEQEEIIILRLLGSYQDWQALLAVID